MTYTTPISSLLLTRQRTPAFQSRCMCEMGFHTTIRCCRPQKDARHARSSHAQLPALPSRTEREVAAACSAKPSLGVVEPGDERLEVGLVVERTGGWVKADHAGRW